MTRDFCIRLTFAAHRVANALGNDALAKLLKECANAVLADFVLLTDNGIVSPSQKRGIAERVLLQVEKMEYLFWGAKGIGTVSADNFVVLERDYQMLREFCASVPTVAEPAQASYLEQRKEEKAGSPAPQRKRENQNPRFSSDGSHGFNENVSTALSTSTSTALSTRQNKILEILRTKEKAQVWELQKVLPEVTKRTLRRDLDDLLEKKRIERHGEWNAVFYRIRREQIISN